MFYPGNRKAFFLPGLITTLCEGVGVPLFDADKVLPMDSPFHPLWSGWALLLGARRGKLAWLEGIGRPQIRTVRIHSHVGEDLEVVQKRIGSDYAIFSPVQPNTSWEAEMLSLQLRQERKKTLTGDLLMTRMWKTIKVIFCYVSLDIEIPWLQTQGSTRSSSC